MKVRTIIRSPDKLPERIKNHEDLTIIHATLLDLSDEEMRQHVKDRSAIASCLGII